MAHTRIWNSYFLLISASDNPTIGLVSEIGNSTSSTLPFTRRAMDSTFVSFSYKTAPFSIEFIAFSVNCTFSFIRYLRISTVALFPRIKSVKYKKSVRPASNQSQWTLPLQLTQPRHPHGTQEILLSAATFLS